MAILVDLPQTLIPASTQRINADLPAGITTLTATITRVAWPAGPVGRVDVTRPDGAPFGAFAFDGVATQKDGITPATETRVTISAPNGAELMAGRYVLSVVVLQAVTAAIRVEAA